MLTLDRVKESKIIAIVRGLSPEYMLKLADALYAGGIDLIEVTFNQSNPNSWKDTATTINAIREHMIGKMLVGAGTVLTEEQLRMAIDAGANYIVTPNTNPHLICKAKEAGLSAFPGAFTASEIVTAYQAGADAVKVFPVGNLGPSYIKALCAPLSNIPLLAVGGVNPQNIAEFLKAGCCGAGVGGNLVNKDWINAGDWDKITALAHEYRKAVEIL